MPKLIYRTSDASRLELQKRSEETAVSDTAKENNYLAESLTKQITEPISSFENSYLQYRIILHFFYVAVASTPTLLPNGEGGGSPKFSLKKRTITCSGLSLWELQGEKSHPRLGKERIKLTTTKILY